MDVFKLFNKKTIPLAVFFVLAVVVVVSILNYINSQQFITIRYKNISKVTIQKFKQGTKGPQDITIIPRSGEKIKVPKGHYLLKYTGNNGYNSDYENIIIEDDPISISLDPDYSEDRLVDILDQEFENIKSVLNAKYQKMSNYAIEKGKVYKKGKWYATTLQYIGDDYFNYDSLRLVMEKENGNWKLITTPPDIIISSQKYPSIPRDILQDLNNVKNINFIDKYTDPNSKVYFP